MDRHYVVGAVEKIRAIPRFFLKLRASRLHTADIHFSGLDHEKKRLSQVITRGRPHIHASLLTAPFDPGRASRRRRVTDLQRGLPASDRGIPSPPSPQHSWKRGPRCLTVTTP